MLSFNIKGVNLISRESCLMLQNGSVMVSTGIKITEFPIKDLGKTFYFVIVFFFLIAKSKYLET